MIAFFKPWRRSAEIALLLLSLGTVARSELASSTLKLENERLKLVWTKESDGWHLGEIEVGSEHGWTRMDHPSGRHTILYLNRNPSTALVELDREGKAYPFFPA